MFKNFKQFFGHSVLIKASPSLFPQFYFSPDQFVKGCEVRVKAASRSFVSDTPKFMIVKPRANGSSLVGCCMLRPLAHPVACCCLWLGVVAQTLKPVKLLDTFTRELKQPPTLLRQ